MAKRLLLAARCHAALRLIADATQQAIAHFAQQVVSAALVRRMAACAEKDCCATGEVVGFVADVAVMPAQRPGHGLNALQVRFVDARFGMTKQFFDFVTL